MPQLKLTLLTDEVVHQIIDEAMQLLVDPGIRIHNHEALTLLADAGCKVDFEKKIAFMPEILVRRALSSTVSEFHLYDLDGKPVVHYGGDDVHFDPGSASIAILDYKTGQQRSAVTDDFSRFVKLVETLPQIDAQSTALLCQDVPEEIGDLYRLYIALNFMRKPIITGAFRVDSWHVMKDMLVAVAGSRSALAEKPIAVFDACPSPPLLWSDLTCQNLIDCARFNIPAELVSMPLAGATAPVTLAAAVVQHTAENLSGVVIHQLANPGAPIVWGGSPAAFDMRRGTTPMGDVCTWLIDSAYTQVGKTLGLPTHAYLGMSDVKVLDMQAGLETAGGMIMAALAGVNMVSGAGMINFESCQSFEKLVIDAEMIGMTRRLISGIEIRDDPIALTTIRQLGHRADYLSLPHTLKWFNQELYMPSDLIDRSSMESWQKGGSKTIVDRAADKVEKLLKLYHLPSMNEAVRNELRTITTRAAQKFGMDQLPPLTLE